MTKENDNELWKQLVISIKKAAEKQDIRQIRIAEYSNVSRSTIKRILDMQFCPKADILFKMAEAVNIKIEYHDAKI